jgi:uncharacterized membrane protein
MKLLLTAVICLAFAAGLAAGAGAANKTILVTSVTLKMETHDIGAKGVSKGDTIVYRDRLLNAATQFGRKKGARVGSDRGTLTFTGAHTAKYDGSATLPGGTVTLRGLVTGVPGGGLIVPVVGGTGAFAHVHGTLTVGAGRNHVLNTYRLVSSSLPIA